MTTWISSTLPGLCLRRCLGSDRSVASRLRRPARSRPGRRRVGRGAWGWAGETHGGVIITCLQDCRNCFRVVLSGDNRVKKLLTLPTIHLKLAIMIVFTTLTTSMRHRVFYLEAMGGENYKIRQSLQDQLILQMYHTYLTLRIVEKDIEII